MHVILVHGYLAPGLIFWPISRRLKSKGMTTATFDYPSRRGTLDEHAHALSRVIDEQADRDVGLVGHSLGGLVIRRALEWVDTPPKRVIFIATPHRGSALSRRMRRSFIAPFMSDAVRQTASGLTAPVRAKEVGVIVGTRDRTVRPEEAYLGDDKSLSLPFRHNELLLKASTAQAVEQFMTSGEFEQPLQRRVFLEQLNESS